MVKQKAGDAAGAAADLAASRQIDPAVAEQMTKLGLAQ
jgi:hypothetical protein